LIHGNIYGYDAHTNNEFDIICTMSTERRLTPKREMLPEGQKRAVERWEVVEDFRWQGGFLLSNGEILGGLMGEHYEIAASVLPDEEEPLLAFQETGAIRMKGGIAGLGLCMELMVEPSAEQIRILRRFYLNLVCFRLI